MTDLPYVLLPVCKLCGCAAIPLIDGSVKHDELSSRCSLRLSVLTGAEWTALMGVDWDAVRYRWLRRKVGATGPAGNDYRKWQFTFPTNLTLKVSELNITDIESDFNNAIDSAMGEQQ